MINYTEEQEIEVKLTDAGDKVVTTYTSIFKDGVFFSGNKHTETIHAEDDVPQDIADFIEAKKVKQPKKDKDVE